MQTKRENKGKKKTKNKFLKKETKRKKHMKVWITYAFVLQCMQTNVMADEQEVYVLWNGESFQKGHLFKEPRKK